MHRACNRGVTGIDSPRATPRLLFVYGSLRRGGVNFSVLARLGARFICPGETLRAFPLVQGPRWRQLHDRPGVGARVRGELFEVRGEAAWAALDWFEEHPHGYRRRVEAVIDAAGAERPAWIYFFHQRCGSGLT